MVYFCDQNKFQVQGMHFKAPWTIYNIAKNFFCLFFHISLWFIQRALCNHAFFFVWWYQILDQCGIQRRDGFGGSGKFCRRRFWIIGVARKNSVRDVSNFSWEREYVSNWRSNNGVDGRWHDMYWITNVTENKSKKSKIKNQTDLEFDWTFLSKCEW